MRLILCALIAAAVGLAFGQSLDHQQAADLAQILATMAR